jgi:hypothetical protein
MVTLVGWDDAEGVWYLKNSWGTYWGEAIPGTSEKGYMRIGWGTALVGTNTTSLAYPAQTGTCYGLTAVAGPAGGGTVTVAPGTNCAGV